MYNFLIRPFVKRMDPEKASRVALGYFRLIGRIPGVRYIKRLTHTNKARGAQREVFGLKFYNPLGLGAGLDTLGDVYNDLNNMGFSFVEIGPMDAKGMRHAINNLQEDPQDDILAACINADYQTAFTLGYDFCDFFVFDIHGTDVASVIDPLLDTRLTYDEYRPIVIKVQETVTDEEIGDIVHYCLMNGVDAIDVRSRKQLDAAIRYSNGLLPVIVNAHIKSAKQAEDLLNAGASLLEIRSGVVYEGTNFVSRINRHLESLSRKSQVSN